MKKLRTFMGIGVVDVDYPVTRKENGKTVWVCPYYSRWKNMIYRSTSDKLHTRYPTYKDTTICDEWLSLSNFRYWMKQQDWEGKHLDKDLLIQGNKHYSPTTCVFVDQQVNKFLLAADSIRGEFPVGVYYDRKKKRFVAQCSDPFTGKTSKIGLFHTAVEAHQAWKKRKHELACQLADLQTDSRVADALRTRFID